MEANGKMLRLKEALDNSEFIKIIFQYPSSSRAIIKSGKVIGVHIDSFDFEEIYDGKVTYSYDWIVEIKVVEGKG
jgi:ABC-type thiamin/hydroxymethylpyrimidine transport system permease subunit